MFVASWFVEVLGCVLSFSDRFMRETGAGGFLNQV